MKTAVPKGGGADDARKTARPGISTISAATTQDLTINTLRFRRAVERVHRLGPRVVGELLIEAGASLDRVERFADLDRFPPDVLNAIGADRWPVTIFAVSSI